MHNTGKFAGKTILITGASRGIGKEVGLKLAKDGANIVIAAKTAEPHPKLPGTIYTAAEEIKKAGGNALPCIVDVRDEESVEKCIEAAVKEFGGIDILVNNASAISLTGTLDTPMKRYDLMHNINTRGTFLMSQKAIPYLKQSKNAHILNMSPPLLMEPQWFAPHVAYTMAKYGMSMCVLGMADELRSDGIAVNALWPRTLIWTSAALMLGGGEEEFQRVARKPEILADCAYWMLQQPPTYTQNFELDEALLRRIGIKDLDKYAYDPKAKLNLDFFIPKEWQDDDNVVSKL
jgi:citronellol/citronellal dehydrogenase